MCKFSVVIVSFKSFLFDVVTLPPVGRLLTKSKHRFCALVVTIGKGGFTVVSHYIKVARAFFITIVLLMSYLTTCDLHAFSL